MPSPSYLVLTDAPWTGLGAHLQDLIAVGTWTSGEETPYQCAGDEDSLSFLKCLHTLGHGPSAVPLAQTTYSYSY